MNESTRLLSSALVSGSIASVVSTSVLALLAKLEGKSALRPINATSHWLHGSQAGRSRDIDIAHTATGFATHHASSILWAFAFELLRARSGRNDIASIARDASVVSATAAVVDYGLLPRRITPGWELVLPKRSVAAGLAALAAGLTVGGVVTRHFNDRQRLRHSLRRAGRMAIGSRPVDEEPAGGARKTIGDETERQQPEPGGADSADIRDPAPGDEAPAGTPGTGEDICPQCRGSGRLRGKPCANCNGSGRIIQGIGGG